MLFNSWGFVAFFLIVYSGYLALGKWYHKQNALLLVASYIFYGCWNWRFLFLLAFTSVVDFFISQRIFHATDRSIRTRLLWLSICMNLGVLGVFKYYNFFVESAAPLLHLVGWDPNMFTRRIILPVGISFYTFQAMSYTIDVYRGDMRPARTLWEFLLYVSFFPHLVAGPIQRVNLLTQISAPRRVRAEQVHAALYLLLSGYFKKVVVADNVGVIADTVFKNYAIYHYHGIDPILGALAFTVQIYGDFSGYSDIARGLAKLMGFELMVNFKLPYFARTPQEFWRRWHISLSTWLRDYVYIPLGGSRGGLVRTVRNLAVTMLLGGLWHGAAWTFVLWGAYHAALLIGYHLWDRQPAVVGPPRRALSSLAQVGKTAFMFVLTVIGWIIFRSRSLEQLGYMLTHMGLQFSTDSRYFGYTICFFSVPLLAMEYWQCQTRNLLAPTRVSVGRRALVYSMMVVWLCAFGARKSMEFIYFQF